MHNTVSVIVPVHGHAEYLAECLDSILNQRLSRTMSLEILVVVDGDPDALTVAMPYNKKGVGILNLTKNVGAYPAMNTGLQFTSGNHVTFCGADDTMHSDRCLTLSRAIYRGGRMCVSNAFNTLMDEKSNMIRGTNGGVLGGIYMWHRHMFDTLGGFRHWPVSADIEFLNRAKAFGAHVKIVKKELYNYRRHSEQLTSRPESRTGSKIREKYDLVAFGETVAEKISPVLGEVDLYLPGKLFKAS